MPPDAPETDGIDADDILIRAAVYRERFIASVSSDLIGRIREAEIAHRGVLIARLDSLSSPDRVRYLAGRRRETARTEALADEVDVIAATYRGETSSVIAENGRELAGVERDLQRDMLADEGITGEVATAASLYALARARPFAGGVLLADAMRTMTVNVRRTIERTVREGLLRSDDGATIARTLMGRHALTGDGSTLGVHRRGADTITRTALSQFGNQAANDTIAALGVERYMWLSTLDGKTSAICRARDRKTYAVGEGPLPPAHPRCRSVTVAVTPARLARTRASRGSDGRKPVESVSYGPWLRRQDRAFVEDTMGKTAARLFLDGRLGIEKFVDHKTLRPLTIEQLRRRHGELFRRLRIDEAA